MKYSYVLFIVFLFSCTKPKVRKPVSHKTFNAIEASIKRNKTIIASQTKTFEAIMADDITNKYLSSPSGFWYYYNHKIDTDSKQPIKGDLVLFSYEIFDIENKIIYTKEQLGDKNKETKGVRTLKIEAEDFLEGMQKGLQLIKPGEEATFLFPSDKVFGVRGFQDKIAPNQPLIIKVKLHKIIK